ncbi:DnaJ domain-containing protein [Roridomyces roridus]|uniref:DnaJ domain-containing protein n=1 Tax=Roridomyces roridus TaxID=1738132 RepID=A0AAD7BZ13_9AGAR|nr:DnaJ domain-containing protein [Roridomyces roridus]
MSATAPTAEINPYELLELKLECSEQEIRTAYRQTSRKVHPDRNRNDPDAARKFHELTQAYELLLDPLRRLALDAKLRVKAARDARFKTYDTKRKNMVSELEERERAFKKAKMDQERDEASRWADTEKIKDEGRRMREERETEIRRREREAEASRNPPVDDDSEAPTLDPLDTTIHLKFKLSAHPELTNREALAKLLAPFGAIDTESIVISCKPPKKSPEKPPKYGMALVPFKQIGDAFGAVCASGRADRGLDGVEVGWVGGKEPQILGWLKKMGKLSAQPLPPKPNSSPLPPHSSTPGSSQLPQTAPAASASPFSSFPATFPDLPSFSSETKAAAPGVDYEALTLMRLRQAERERLEREILEQEAAEGA